MSFAMRPSTDLVSVEAGANVPLTTEVVNKGDELDRYELEVEGLDPEWVAIPVPHFPAEPGETHSEKIFFKPPRSSESLAGNYPFVVKVRSLTSGEQKTAQGVIQIRPYHHVSMEISPKKGFVSPFRKQNAFGVTIMNLGNTDHQLQLVGSDPEDECAFDFEHDQVTVSPGQQKDVEVVVTPKTSSFMSPSRLFGFMIHARSIDPPSVATTAQGQLEQRAFLSPSTLAFLVFVTLLLGAWLYMMPKPPTVEMGVSPERIVRGEQVRVWYRAANANKVVIMADNVKIADSDRLSDDLFYTPSKGGDITFTAVSSRGEKHSDTYTTTIHVDVPIPAPDPKIVSFKASPTTVKVGQKALLTYKFNEAVVKATLLPTNQDLTLGGEQIEVEITSGGPKKFTIVAENKDHKSVTQSVTVVGNEVSLATIIVFRPDQALLEYPGGLVNLTWQTSDAVRVELTSGSQTEEVEPKGTISKGVDRTTTFALRAYDKSGKWTEKTTKVTVKPQPQLPPDETYQPSGP